MSEIAPSHGKRSTLQRPALTRVEERYPHPAAAFPIAHTIGELQLQCQILSRIDKPLPLYERELAHDTTPLKLPSSAQQASSSPGIRVVSAMTLAQHSQQSALYDMEVAEVGGNGLIKDELDLLFLKQYSHMYNIMPRYHYAGENLLPSAKLLEDMTWQFRAAIAAAKGRQLIHGGMSLRDKMGTMVLKKQFLPTAALDRRGCCIKAYSASWVGTDHIIIARQDGRVEVRCISSGRTIAYAFGPPGQHSVAPGSALTAAGFAKSGDDSPTTLASGGLHNVVNLWSLPSIRKGFAKAKLCRQLVGHAGYISSVSCLPDGQRLLSGSGDGTAMLWDIEHHKCTMALIGHDADVTAIGVATACGGNVCCTSSIDGTARVWDVRAGACVRLFEMPGSEFGRRAAEDIAMTDGGEAVVCALGTATSVEKGRCRFAAFDVGSYQLLTDAPGSVDGCELTTSCCSVAFVHGGRCVLSGSESGSLLLTDLSRAQSSETSRCFDPAFGKAGSKPWPRRHSDWTGGKPHFSAHLTRICSLATPPDGSDRVVSASFDGLCKLWLPEGFERFETLENEAAHIHQVRCSTWGNFRARVRAGFMRSGRSGVTVPARPDVT